MNNYEINPGEQLRNFIKSLYPLDMEDNTQNQNRCFIDRVDHLIMAEGSFRQLVYDSTINYLIRTLIKTAEYLRRKYESDNFPPEQFIIELRKFLKSNIRLDDNDCEKLLAILQICLEVKSKSLKGAMKRQVRRNLNENQELRCYICGRALSSANKEDIHTDHIFPQTMGGATEEFNLKVACKKCNENKSEYIDSTDFHYEQMCFVSEKGTKSFNIELERKYQIAIWAKSQYSCSICGKPALEVGRLDFGRINLSDSWHFLNMEAYCNEHQPE